MAEKETLMRAYRWNGPGSGLQLQQVPRPHPSAGEILLKVECCGLCHSDCNIIDGPLAAQVTLRPITLGHEVSGIVIALGDDVKNIEIGSRVTVALIANPTKDPQAIGLEFDGGYAEYAVVPIRFIVPIPASVSFEQAAVATDSMVTSYHAITAVAQVNASTTVGIVGLGGLGSVGVRFAVLQGATVYAFDTDTSKFALAKRNGAIECFKHLKEARDVVFDVIVDFVGKSVTMAAAIDAVKTRGRIVLVGLGDEFLKLPTAALAIKCLEIRGSLGGSLDGLQAVLALLDEKKVEPILEEISFDKVNEGLDRLHSGQVQGRLFTRPSPASSNV